MTVMFRVKGQDEEPKITEFSLRQVEGGIEFWATDLTGFSGRVFTMRPGEPIHRETIADVHWPEFHRMGIPLTSWGCVHFG